MHRSYLWWPQPKCRLSWMMWLAECVPQPWRTESTCPTPTLLHEIQYFISVVPFGLPRALTCDTHLRGYFLPKVPNESGDPAQGRGGPISGSEHSQLTHKGFLTLASNWSLF